MVRIGRSRVTLEQIVHAFDAGTSPEETVESYPSLELGDVYAAIVFMIKNRKTALRSPPGWEGSRGILREQVSNIRGGSS